MKLLTVATTENQNGFDVTKHLNSLHTLPTTNNVVLTTHRNLQVSRHIIR